MSLWSPKVPFNDLPDLPPAQDAETKAVPRAVTEVRVAVTRLDRAADLMPDPSVLINIIPLLEAQASSEIENIVTTADALFWAQLDDDATDPAVEETLEYRSALRFGFGTVAAHVTPGARNADFLGVLFAQPHVRIGDVMDCCQ